MMAKCLYFFTQPPSATPHSAVVCPRNVTHMVIPTCSFPCSECQVRCGNDHKWWVCRNMEKSEKESRKQVYSSNKILKEPASSRTSSVNMEAPHPSKKSVHFYQTTWCHIPHDLNVKNKIWFTIFGVDPSTKFWSHPFNNVGDELCGCITQPHYYVFISYNSVINAQHLTLEYEYRPFQYLSEMN